MIRPVFRSQWVRMVIAAALGAAVVGAIWLVISAGDDSEPQGGEVELSFEPGPQRDEALLRREFEHARDTLNREIKLPRDLRIRLASDQTAERLGISGPTYVPKDHTVYFPWSFVDGARDDLERFGHRLQRSKPPRDQLRNAMLFALYHELTHGLVDVLDVPIVGGEERAADSLGAIFAIRSQRGGQIVPLSGAGLEEAEAQREGPPGLVQYADDHELDAERAVDALCLAYGSDPKRNRGFIGKDLTPSRAENCAFDYSNELRSWRRLLDAWLTEEGGLRPLGR